MEAGTVSVPTIDPLSAQTAEKAAPHQVAADSSTLISNGSSDVGCERDARAAQPQGPSQDPGGLTQRTAVASTSSCREGLPAPVVGALVDGGASSAGGTEARSSVTEGAKQARIPAHKCSDSATDAFTTAHPLMKASHGSAGLHRTEKMIN